MDKRFMIDNGDDEGPREAVWADEYDRVMLALCLIATGGYSRAEAVEAAREAVSYEPDPAEEGKPHV